MSSLVEQKNSKELRLQDLDREKVELLKTSIFKDSTDDELKLFLYTCNRVGLDPFMKQIYAVKRWDSGLRRETMTVQVAIDGYRLIAERTGRYAPGPETIFQYDDKGRLVSATANVKKLTSDGTWHTVSATVFYSEYCQTTKEGKPNNMWAKMPHTMLSKVAEAHALRRCFPTELSGIYTKEEMDQADSIINQQVVDEMISDEKVQELKMIIGNHTECLNKLFTWAGIDDLSKLRDSQYEKAKKGAISCVKRIEAQEEVACATCEVEE